MKISVIIPTYKPKSYIWQCLDSLHNQKLNHEYFEVIIVLNGCKEPYYSELQAYCNTHSNTNWKLIQIDKGGVSNARNLALRVFKGDYVAFIDDDDYVSSDYLGSLLELAARDTVVLSDACAFYDDTKEINETYGPHCCYLKYSSKKDVRLISVSKYFNGPWMKLLHKDIIGNKTFEPRFKNGEDSLFMFSVSDKINQIKMANSNATYYRRFRRDGACYSKFSIAYSIRNNLLLLAYYLGYWLSNPLKYNFLFFINRQCANIKDMIYNIFNIRF